MEHADFCGVRAAVLSLQAYEDDATAVAVADNAEKFDPATEHVLSYLQVRGVTRQG
jgi:hypothetical protein